MLVITSFPNKGMLCNPLTGLEQLFNLEGHDLTWSSLAPVLQGATPVLVATSPYELCYLKIKNHHMTANSFPWGRDSGERVRCDRFATDSNLSLMAFAVGDRLTIVSPEHQRNFAFTASHGIFSVSIPSSSGGMVLYEDSSHVYLWRHDMPTEIEVLPHPSAAAPATIAPDGSVVFGFNDVNRMYSHHHDPNTPPMFLYSTRTGKCRCFQDDIYSVAFRPDSNTIALGASGAIRMYTLRTQDLSLTFLCQLDLSELSTSWVLRPRFCPTDGQLLVFRMGSMVYVLHLELGVIRTYVPLADPPPKSVLSPDAYNMALVFAEFV